MKKIIDWLFGYYRHNPVLQGIVAGVVIAHLCVLAMWTTAWLYEALPWPR